MSTELNSTENQRIIELLNNVPRELRDHIYSYLWGEKITYCRHRTEDNYRDRRSFPSKIPFPWPNLGPVFSREAAQWAYENVDVKYLLRTFHKAQDGLELTFVCQYLREGLFDLGVAPRDVRLSRMTVVISRMLKTRDLDELWVIFNTLSMEAKFKKACGLKLVISQISIFPVIEVQSLSTTCRTLKEVVTMFEAKGVSVDVEILWEFYVPSDGSASFPPRARELFQILRWPLGKDMLGAPRRQLQLLLLNEWKSNTITRF